EVANVEVPASLLVDSWDGRMPFDAVANPVISAELAGIDLVAARAAGVVGVIAVWRGLADVEAHGQYLPFTRPYAGLPAVWAPESERERLLEA
ncbi:hypothetical protein, partial [Staphylococcus aureus]